MIFGAFKKEIKFVLENTLLINSMFAHQKLQNQQEHAEFPVLRQDKRCNYMCDQQRTPEQCFLDVEKREETQLILFQSA